MTMRGVYRGTVRRIDTTGCYVWVERRENPPPHGFGPLEALEGPWRAGQNTDTADGHVHGVGPDLAEDDDVWVAEVEGRPDDFMILGRRYWPTG